MYNTAHDCVHRITDNVAREYSYILSPSDLRPLEG